MSGTPNTFQTSNLYVDRAMELLTDSELRVLLYATRHIMGWQDKIEKRTGAISLAMFENGYTTKGGQRYGGCGLGRAAIIKAVESLVKFGFMERSGQPTEDGQAYQIPTDKIDWRALENRHAKNTTKAKQQTAKATAVRKQGGTSNDTGTSDDTPTGTSDDTVRGNVGRTESNTSSNSSSNPLKDSTSDAVQTWIPLSEILKAWIEFEAEAAKKTRNLAISELIKAWLNGSGAVDPTAYQKKGYRTRFGALVDQGIIAENVTAYLAAMRADPFWKDKGISVNKLAGEIVPWLWQHSPKAKPAQPPPEEPIIPVYSVDQIRAEVAAAKAAFLRGET